MFECLGILTKNAWSHADIGPLDLFDIFRWSRIPILFDGLTNENIRSSALFVLVVLVASQVDKRLIENVTVYVVVCVDCFRGQVVVVKVTIRIAVDVGCKKYARIRISYTQAWILCFVHFHLQLRKLVRNLLPRSTAIVFDEQIKIALFVFRQIERFVYFSEALKS